MVPGRYPEPASSLMFRGRDGSFVPDRKTPVRLADLAWSAARSSATWTATAGRSGSGLRMGPIRLFRNDHGTLALWDLKLTFPSRPKTRNSELSASNFQPSTVAKALKSALGNGVALSEGYLAGARTSGSCQNVDIDSHSS